MVYSTHYKLRFNARKLLIGIILVISLTPVIPGQTTTGGIRGVITDSSGAVLPNAKITAKNLATGVAMQSTSNGEGFYSFPRILPGKYTVSIELSSFKKQEFKDVEILLGKDAVIDASLEPGEISEVVTVTAGAEAMVEKSSMQISTTFSQQKVEDLPVSQPGVGLDRIALLTPGVTIGFSNVNGNGTTLSANGQRARSNNFTIDGVDNNDLSIGGPNYFIRNSEVVAEYQVITNNFSAEYGRNQGAVVNIVSKSGGNAYHGSGGWDHLDQKNFDSLTNIERRRGDKNPPPNLNNIFTYGVGGPVIKDRIFFFTSGYMRFNPQLAESTSTSLAPTPAGAQALKAAFPDNDAIQYYSDYSAFMLPIGNPQVRPDVAQSTITIGSTTVPVAALRRLVPRNIRQDEFTGRSDVNLTDKHRLWGRYFWQRAPGQDQLVGVEGFTGDQPTNSRQIGGGWTYTINSQLVNEARFNYSKLDTIFGGGATGGKGQIPHPDEIDTALARFNPNFTADNGVALLQVGPATNLPQGRIVEAYQFTDNVTMTAGRHQMKAGFDFRILKNVSPFLPNVNGSFQFDSADVLATNTPTSLQVAFGPATLSYDEFDHFYYFQDDWRIKPNLTLNLGVRYENTGQPINLLNRVTREREQDSATAFWRQTVPVEQRVNPSIPTDRNNWAPRLGFVYTPQFGSGPMGLLFGRDKTTLRGGYGIAYDATFYNLMLNISTAAPTVFLTSAVLGVPDPVPTGDKVRGAATAAGLIKFNTFDPRYFNRTTINPLMSSPYAQQWSFGIQREIGRNVLEARYVGTHGVGLFQTINVNPFIGNLVNGFSRTYFDPVSGTSKSMTFPGYPNLLPGGIRPLSCTNDMAPDKPDDESVCNGRILPTGLARERINGAQNIYHALQMRFDGRLRNTVSYGLTYTWSKNIDNTSEVFSADGGNSVTVSSNPLDLTRLERGLSGFDVPHSFTANFVWELPFMRSQRGILGRVIGGWQLNGILRVQNGIHFTPTIPGGRNPYEDNTYMSAFIGSVSHFRPFAGNPQAARNRVGITDVDACIFYLRCGRQGGASSPPVLRTSSTGYYLFSDLLNNVFTPVSPNDVRFIINGPRAAANFGTPFGNLARNTEAADRIEAFDFSVFKSFKVTERINLQYRLEMFNALNHPVFGLPNSIQLDNRNFYNFLESSGGRRTISMGLRIHF
jgi:outer membrane receptor protein involved in Fe transport